MLTTYFVDNDAAGDGSSWASAFNNLQDALSAANAGDEIWVAAGTYKPTNGLDRAISFNLKSGVSLYGGFAGNEMTIDERDWQANPTILSGDIGVVGPLRTAGFDNSYHVVFASGVIGVTLDGLIVTGGNANSSDGNNRFGGGIYNNSSLLTLTNVTITGNQGRIGIGIYNLNSSPTLTNVTISSNFGDGAFFLLFGSSGGGIYNDNSSPTLTNVTIGGNFGSFGGGIHNTNNSSPTLTNVTITGNSSHIAGGGIYNAGGSPTLLNVTISGNTVRFGGATCLGGGIYNAGGSPTLTNVTISDNSADRGGGLYNASSSPRLTNVFINGNSADDTDFGGGFGGGGGIYNASGSPILMNVTIKDNFGDHGGGMYNDNSSPTLINVIITGNAASSRNFPGFGGRGGGIYNDGSSPTLVNVTLSDNSADHGGGIFTSSGSPTLTNVTITGNSATSASFPGFGGGGGIYNAGGSPTLTNCIVWSNTGEVVADGQILGSATVTYSIVEGGWAGIGNLDADPLFVDAAAGNLRVMSGSAAIDAGTNSGAPNFDLDGTLRPLDGDNNGTAVVDMGAYEFKNAQALVAAIADVVANLADEGIINQGQANGLTAKLNSANKKLAQGQTATAVNQLEAFENQVLDLVRRGQLPAQQGAALIAMAEEAIELAFAEAAAAADAAFAELDDRGNLGHRQGASLLDDLALAGWLKRGQV